MLNECYLLIVGHFLREKVEFNIRKMTNILSSNDLTEYVILLEKYPILIMEIIYYF